MRLSDVKGDRVIDVIADIIEPVANIGMDENITAIFKKVDKIPEGMSNVQFTLDRVRKFAPALLRKHKQDAIIILSTIAGVSQEEYTKKLTLTGLINDLTELFTDPEFETLFMQWQTSENKETVTSGSVSENTTEQKQ